ncbi:MAG TPA: ribosome maturation factor RimM [Gaiellaceae bacterium]|jgi:16S rRNA processing protein RimM|nr:ribosome maturation factor RimM [Gaiellaceae bacterium]
MTRWIRVGRVGRPHGLDGAFVVEEASEDPERFAPGARVYVGREPATVAESKRAGGRLVVRLDGKAERDAPLELPESELPEPEEGTWYAFQLVGLEVEEEGGRALGKVLAVEPGIANDVLDLSSGESLPVVAACIRSVDVEAGRILVAPGFASPR